MTILQRIIQFYNDLKKLHVVTDKDKIRYVRLSDKICYFKIVLSVNDRNIDLDFDTIKYSIKDEFKDIIIMDILRLPCSPNELICHLKLPNGDRKRSL